MRLPHPAPGVGAHDKVVLFDAVCKLCHGWSRFLMRVDRRHAFKLATVQSPEGKAILEWAGLPTDHYDTLVLVEGDRVYVRSAAILRVLARLPLPWPLLVAGWIVPRPLRDWAYDRVARNRYRLFGRYDACVLPTPDHLARFLKPEH